MKYWLLTKRPFPIFLVPLHLGGARADVAEPARDRVAQDQQQVDKKAARVSRWGLYKLNPVVTHSLKPRLVSTLESL